jgi:hypothetical protein
MLVLREGHRRRERVELAVGAYPAAIEAPPQFYRFLLRRHRPGEAVERGAGGGWCGGLMGRIDTTER